MTSAGPSGPAIESVSGRLSEAADGQLEEHQRALDRALLRGRVGTRDRFLGFDLAAEGEGVEAFARDRFEFLVPRVGDRERVGERLGLFALVLDFEEDAEVGRAFRRRRLADQVGRVLVVVGVEEAREDHWYLSSPSLTDLALDHVLGVARVAAGGDGEGEHRQRKGGEQRQDESAATGHRRREPIKDGSGNAGRVAVAAGDGHPAGAELPRLELLAQPPQRLAPAPLVAGSRPRRAAPGPGRRGSTARSRRRRAPWSASPGPRSAPRASSTESG